MRTLIKMQKQLIKNLELVHPEEIEVKMEVRLREKELTLQLLEL